MIYAWTTLGSKNKWKQRLVFARTLFKLIQLGIYDELEHESMMQSRSLKLSMMLDSYGCGVVYGLNLNSNQYVFDTMSQV